MMRRLMPVFACAVLLMAVSMSAKGQQSDKGERAAPDSKVDAKILIRQAAVDQAGLLRSYKSLCNELNNLATRKEKGGDQDKEEAKRIRSALNHGRDKLLEKKFEDIVSNLNRPGADQNLDVLADLNKLNKELVAELSRMRELLETDSNAERREKLRKRSELLEQLKELIAKQERVRAATDIGQKKHDDLKRDQNKVTKETGETANPKGKAEEIGGERKAEGKGEKGEARPDKGEYKGGEKKPGEGERAGEGRNEGKPESKAEKGGEGKPGDGKEGKAGEGREGEGKEGQQAQKPASGKGGEPKEGASKGGDPKGGEGKAGEGKGGEGKEGKPGDGKGKGGEGAESKSGMGKEGKEGQGGEGKGGDGKGGEGAAGEGKSGGDPKGGEGKPGEGKEGAGKGGEGSKTGEGKAGAQGDPKGGEGKPGAGKGGETAGGQPKAGEGRPGEGKGGKGGEGKPGEGKGQAGKGGEGKPGAGKPSEGAGKPGEGKAGGGKSGEGKPGAGKGDGKPSGGMGGGKSGEGKPGEQPQGGSKGEGKPGESKAGSKSGSGKPGEGKGGGKGGSKSGEGKKGGGGGGGGGQQDDDDELKDVRKKIEDANKYQKQAEIDLDRKKNNDASGNQGKAIDELEKARKKLEELLKQMREEEIERILADLEKRCRYMLALQKEVKEGTVVVDSEIQKTPTRKAELIHAAKSEKLKIKEEEILREADAALKIIQNEGSAVAFAEVFVQVRTDMENVVVRLGKTDVGKVTQQIEDDIIATLTEMIEALQKAQRESKSDPKKGKSPPGMPQDQKLIDQIAELKMIFAMQKRVYNRTQMYGKQYQGEQAPPPDSGRDVKEREHYDMIARELLDLSGRQKKIQRITKDIATGKNEAR